ncbi:MAG: tripartite tricarboxylate transporter TctB family protein [Afipia sp.]|nr:tripartite tricarboxylate transporter TctB family protein [Afipia sp.]
MPETLLGKIRWVAFGNADRISGFFLIAVACIALVSAVNLPFGTLRSPDSGFFPRSLSVLLLIFGLGIYLFSFVKPVAALEIDYKSWRVAIAAIALCVYAVTLPYVGFIIDTILILLLMMRGFGQMSWRLAAMIALPSVVVAYFGFVELGVQLPKGVLPF